MSEQLPHIEVEQPDVIDRVVDFIKALPLGHYPEYVADQEYPPMGKVTDAV